ncbi:MAG: YhjD/YihY/BrkB family envelope integrity protein [Conexibacter sp.]
MRPDPLTRIGLVVQRAIALAEASLERLVAVQFVDRAVALGSLGFTALVPLLVISAAFVPGTDGLANTLIERFHLSGSTADLVRQVFAQPDDVRQSLSWLGLVLLIASALSFTRALQRVYEHAWQLPARGWRGTRAGLVWLGGIVVWTTIFATARRWLLDVTGSGGALVVLLGGNALLWLWTPWTLLAQRIAWLQLLPTALLTAIAMSGWSIGSAIYMPTAIEDSAAHYGTIGVAIALVSWLVAAGFVLVACAAVGAVLGKELVAPKERAQDVPRPVEPRIP